MANPNLGVSKAVRCISLFSGAGGLDIGAEKAGARVSLCVEIDQDSVKTLRLNDPTNQMEVLEKDITEVDFKRYNARGGKSIIIGGPPCQPFSKNGYWVKNENRLIERDPRNMLSQFLRAVSEAHPSGFLFENVESLLHPTNRETLRLFRDEAETLGFRCTLYRANSADFGVPQIRKRVFVFGVSKKGVAIPMPIPTHSAAPESDGLKPHEGVGRFIEGFDRAQFFEPSEIANEGTYFPELVNVPAGNNYIALSKVEEHTGRTFRSGSRFWNFLYKLHPDKPSITIAAQPGPWVGPFHWNNRRLRVPEIGAIQTFPATYKFYGNRRSIQKQIGNAVPCMLGEAMVRHLLEHL
jgi:DNA (cytosine-5)-methyltransferase 1